MSAKPVYKGEPWVIWTLRHTASGGRQEAPRQGLGDYSFEQTVKHLRLRGDDAIEYQRGSIARVQRMELRLPGAS